MFLKQTGYGYEGWIHLKTVHCPDNRGSKHLCYIGQYLPNYTADTPKDSSYSSPWELDISFEFIWSRIWFSGWYLWRSNAKSGSTKGWYNALRIKCLSSPKVSTSLHEVLIHFPHTLWAWWMPTTHIFIWLSHSAVEESSLNYCLLIIEALVAIHGNKGDVWW
jgi:hypothetical protein